MQISSQQATNYLLGGMAASLLAGYVLRAPDLQNSAQRQTDIRNQETQAAFDRQEAMQRAQRCIVLATELPLSDGTAAYFGSTRNGRIVINKNRPMPSGTTVCDTFGNTGIVAMDAEGTPIVTDLRIMPSEEMEEILSQRGVMPHTKRQTKLSKKQNG
ncbi:MAG TPA: hypothetical protein V6D11_14925 [Waterburya sp.]|jgi:hypothetical protein